MTTLSYTETLTVVHCTCGMAFAIPDSLNQQLLDKRGPHGKSVYCPLGHNWHYVGKTEAEKAQEEAAAARRREQAVRDLLAAEERSHRATKGNLTKARKRAQAGVCQCCGRTFQNVARHMKSKHPDFKSEAAPA